MAGDKLFYYQTLALYAILDVVILYLTFSGFVVGANRNAMYSLFIFLLAFSMFGLFLFTEELSKNYGLSSSNIDFKNTSGGNIQKLSSWGLILANFIAIGVYGYSIATGMSVNKALGSGATEGVAPLAFKPSNGQVGGRRR